MFQCLFAWQTMSGVNFTNSFAKLFFSQTRSEAFFSKWRLANGTQIWQMVHKIQLVNEDFDIAQFLVKLTPGCSFDPYWKEDYGHKSDKTIEKRQ